MRRLVVTLLMCVSVAAGCSAEDTGSPPDATATGPTSASPADEVSTDLVGSWHRAQTCSDMLAAFEAAGLAGSHRGWLQGNFYGGEGGPAAGDPCEGAAGPLEHDHFFTEAGEFGSHDENGEEVDSGDFEVIDDDTVSFPSHATELGYDGELVVDYSIADDVVMFDVTVPEACTDECADAYAWALSAFASGPWERGEVP